MLVCVGGDERRQDSTKQQQQLQPHKLNSNLDRLAEVARVGGVLEGVLPHEHHEKRDAAAPHVGRHAIVLLALQHLYVVRSVSCVCGD